jgi:hypothetical protein
MPVQLDLPLVQQKSKAPPLSISVESHAMLIDQSYETGKQDMDVLHTIISCVSTIGCAYCWILCKSYIGPHEHNPSYLFDTLLSSLCAKKRENNMFQLSCYCCWVSFQVPCRHPSIKKGDLILPEDCPHLEIPHLIPTLCSLVYIYDDPSRPFLSQVSATLTLDPPLSHMMSQFLQWVTEPAPSADRVPNFALFPIAFSKCFNRLYPLTIVCDSSVLSSISV